jgi:transglutaminase-like putative cysteine protease
MRIRITNRADYRYESPVSFSPHIFRLFPKVDRFVNVLNAKFTTNKDADVQYRRDLFDNEVAYCFYPEKGTELKSTLVLELELQERNPFHFLLDRHALDFPFQYKPYEAFVLASFLKTQSPNASASLPFWRPGKKPLISALMELNEVIRKNIKYEVRDEGVARDPAETLALGVGSCRDYSWMLADTLRANGVAARLASGYFCEFGEGEKRAEGTLHAWVEAYLPGAGWVGMDPTNGTLTDHNHITAAVGLLPEDIAPQQGSYYYKETRVPYTMEAALELFKCEE